MPRPDGQIRPTVTDLDRGAVVNVIPRWMRGSRNANVEPCAGVAGDLDPAAVQLDERLDQAEAQADPALAELVSRPRSGAWCRSR